MTTLTTSAPEQTVRPSRAPSSTARPPSKGGVIAQHILTAVLVVGPLVAVAVEMLVLWGRAVHLRDVLLGVVLIAVTGHGVTIGFHRMLTHGSFKPKRSLKIMLTVAGSLAVEGGVVGWVANHRRHHMFSDRAGDPHSPYEYGATVLGQLRGFAHAHVGWLFRSQNTAAKRFAPDLLRDRDIVTINRLFPVLAVTSLALPFAAGWLLSGRTVAGAVTAFVWAGVVRMAVLHHLTWSVNSVCHMFGRRPFAVKDQSANFAPLAIFSMGESWHNFHHAFPCAARHGALPGQLDSSAALIRVFERLGWATNVRWPTPAQIATATSATQTQQ